MSNSVIFLKCAAYKYAMQNNRIKIFFFFFKLFFFFFLDECTFTLFEQLNQIGIFILILTMQGFPGSNPGEKLEQPIAR